MLSKTQITQCSFQVMKHTKQLTLLFQYLLMNIKTETLTKHSAIKRNVLFESS